MNQDWTLPDEAFDYLTSRLPATATILELGSGDGTARLVTSFTTVYSVEHDVAWLDKYPSHYIHAPIVDGWYDASAILDMANEKPDAIIVDGPPGNIGRMGLINHPGLFKAAPLLVDDVQRPAERELAIGLARERGEGVSFHFLANGRAFATIGWAP